ncbi:MAG: type II toxin-antitoxin system HicB family antitoxin [Deltaproteobacteria bacterium]|nr:MAG: type II toxin-antitoxin system HicB family antitoxin [Deltaproteobacteria bacterium]
MNRFLVVIEKTKKNYSAYSPDLPGCVATGRTRSEVEKNIYEAIEMHVEGLKEEKVSIPKSYSLQSISQFNRTRLWWRPDSTIIE